MSDSPDDRGRGPAQASTATRSRSTDVDLAVPAGQHPRRARPQRRRQVDDRPHAHHHDRARRRHRPGRRARRVARGRRPSAGSSASPARTPRSTSCSPAPRTWCWSASCRACRASRPRARAAELLERFELTDAAGRMVKTYSGGMRRRLDLAASLVARPPVLFLDEPTTGLDPTSRQRMWDVIRGLVADGTTVLLTTQYLDEADALADAISVIDHGTVIAEGTARELKARIGGEQLEVTLSAPRRRRRRRRWRRWSTGAVSRARRRSPSARAGRGARRARHRGDPRPRRRRRRGRRPRDPPPVARRRVLRPHRAPRGRANDDDRRPTNSWRH